MKIAISGKGGVGKTTIMAMLAQHLNNNGMEVLVIDADPSPHMAQSIGFNEEDKIIPIADMKQLLAERSGKVDGSPFYHINPQIDDLLSRFIVEKDGIKLMVLGAVQEAGGGCACAESTILKRLLTKLLLMPKQYILLDMEAGVEHLGRGTIANVDHLLVVVIPSRSGIRTGLKIRKLAEEVGIKHISYIGNLITDQEDKEFLIKELGDDIIAFFPDSQKIRKTERGGKPVISVVSEVDEVCHKLLSCL